jgi:hypothetical protein
MMKTLVVALSLVATPAFSQAVVVAQCGQSAFRVGSQHFPTMDPAGYLCVSTTTRAAAASAPDINSTSSSGHSGEAKKENQQ